MRRTWSDPALVHRSGFGDSLIGGSVPGYAGHVPGSRTEEARAAGCTHAARLTALRHERGRPGYEAQALTAASRSRPCSSPAVARTQQPAFDRRGLAHPAAGDMFNSRVPASKEDKTHYQSSLGLTSLTHDRLGGAGKLPAYGSAARGVPGFMGHVPGKHAENVYGEGHSKTSEHAMSAHFKARQQAPKEWSLLTSQGTLVAPTAADTVGEVLLTNPSYHAPGGRRSVGATCEFTGAHVAAAGRAAPCGRQADVSTSVPPVPRKAAHGYHGWVPGKFGEAIIGERQCTTIDIAEKQFMKQRLQNTQR